MTGETARAEKRVALVIGNGAYDHAPALLNPGNDSQGIAERLSTAGFDQIIQHQNLGFEAMRHAIQAFGRAADGADIAVVYYAGHGIELDGANYLVPVDAKLEHDRDVTFEAVSLEQLLNAVEGARRLRLVILDACRDNMFRTRMVRSTRTRSIGRGLADVEPGGNVLVAYAAKSGTVARDGEGLHSPFAEALMDYLAKPGIEIGFLFRHVRDAVLKATGGVQEPNLYGSLGADPIFLVPPEPEADDTSDHDIFISYSRADQPLIEALALELEAEGYSVWWDKKIKGGERFRKATLAALDAARAVIVLWSKASVESDWVYNEANRGSNKLIPIRIGDLDIGLVNPPFGEYHTLVVDDRAGLKVALARLNVLPRHKTKTGARPASELTRKIDARPAHQGGGHEAAAKKIEAPTTREAKVVEPVPAGGLKRPLIGAGLGAAACLALIAGWFAFQGGRPSSLEREQASRTSAPQDVRPGPAGTASPPAQVAAAPTADVAAPPSLPREPTSAPAAIPPAVDVPAPAIVAREPTPPPVVVPPTVDVPAPANVPREPPPAPATPPPAANVPAPAIAAREPPPAPAVGTPNAASPITAPPLATPPPAQQPGPVATGDGRARTSTALTILDAVPVNAGTLGSGVHLFRECVVCPVMAVVPPGQSSVGSPANEPGRSANEGPQRQIVIREPFAVGRSEVTFEEWSACLAEGGCNAHKPGDFGFGTGKRPVIFVSWQDANAYVAWLSRKTGAPYRLLSEAEWEFAGRGCATTACRSTAFWFGNDISPDRANYDWSYSYAGSRKAQRQGQTVPADTGEANPFGLLHVHGNVREWVEDCWNESLVSLPNDGASRTTGDCTRRVLKGGSWSDEPRDLRLAKRSWEQMGERQENIGFRVARTLPR